MSSIKKISYSPPFSLTYDETEVQEAQDHMVAPYLNVNKVPVLFPAPQGSY
jgi:hypothetical protein